MGISEFKDKNETLSSSLDCHSFIQHLTFFFSNAEFTVYMAYKCSVFVTVCDCLSVASCNILTPHRFTLYKCGLAMQG